MPVADIIRLGLAPGMTNQQIADMALAEDQARRAAERRGDSATAAAHDREAERLAALLR